MKRNVFLLLAITLFLLGAAPAKAATKLLTDPSNKHNLSSNATGGRIKADLPAFGGTDEICVFCHTPHGASAQSTLWNRKDPGDGSFTLYSGTTLAIKGEGGYGTAAQASSQYGVDYPNGASRMCLSCHDGNTANFGEVLNAPNATGGGSSIAMVSGTFTKDLTNPTAGDLSNIHPISFIYTTTVAGDIEADRGISSGSAYAVPTVATTPYVTLDSQNRMQCTTCHDPHDDNKSMWGTLPFWRHKAAANATAAYDEVCNACHLAPTYYGGGHGTKDLP